MERRGCNQCGRSGSMSGVRFFSAVAGRAPGYYDTRPCQADLKILYNNLEHAEVAALKAGDGDHSGYDEQMAWFQPGAGGAVLLAAGCALNFRPRVAGRPFCWNRRGLR